MNLLLFSKAYHDVIAAFTLIENIDIIKRYVYNIYLRVFSPQFISDRVRIPVPSALDKHHILAI